LLQALDFSRQLILFLQPPLNRFDKKLIVGSSEDAIDFSIYWR